MHRPAQIHDRSHGVAAPDLARRVAGNVAMLVIVSSQSPNQTTPLNIQSRHAYAALTYDANHASRWSSVRFSTCQRSAWK